MQEYSIAQNSIHTQVITRVIHHIRITHTHTQHDVRIILCFLHQQH